MSQDLVRATTAAVRQAGARLLKRYSTVARQPGLPELMADLRANDLTVVDVLEPALAEILPEAALAQRRARLRSAARGYVVADRQPSERPKRVDRPTSTGTANARLD